jgi:hypothetical protein
MFSMPLNLYIKLTLLTGRETDSGLISIGRAVVQTVSRWLPTSAARVRAQVRSYLICGGQSGTGAGFLQVLRFPCQSFDHPSSAAGTISQLWDDVSSGLNLTPPQETKKGKVSLFGLVDKNEFADIQLQASALLSSSFPTLSDQNLTLSALVLLTFHTSSCVRFCILSGVNQSLSK